MTERMYECEVKKQFLGREKARMALGKGARLKGFRCCARARRCAHCRGAVRVHKQRLEHGPQDHVEHRSRSDSEGCEAGSYCRGGHRLSANPVE